MTEHRPGSTTLRSSVPVLPGMRVAVARRRLGYFGGVTLVGAESEPP
jgi:hypothetical protein